MPGMMQDERMKCPRCHSEKICKNGHKNGKQRFLCKDCRRQFIQVRSQRGYDEAFKQICLKAYRSGKSFREIERTYGVHHTTVLSWVKQAGFDLSEMAISEMARSSSASDLSVPQTLVDSVPSSRVQTEPNAIDLREAILSGALQVFATQSYSSVTLEQISTMVGVSPQTLERYFPNKEALFIALSQQLLDRLPQKLLSLPNGDDLSAAPEVVLRQAAIALLSTFSKDQALRVLVRLVISESERFPDLAKRFIQEVERPLFNQLSTYLKFHPDLQIAEPLVATRLFMGSLMHYWLTQSVQEQATLPEERDRVVESLVAGIIAAA